MSPPTSDTSLAARSVSQIQRHPLIALIGGLLLFAATVAGLGRLQTDFTYRGYFHKTDHWLTVFEDFEGRFGNDDAIVVAIHSPSGIFDRDSIELIREMTEAMWQVPDVIRVDSITNYRWVHANGDDVVIEPLIPDDRPLSAGLIAERRDLALGHETLPGYLISEDGRTSLLFGQIRPGGEQLPDAQKITDAVRALAAESQRTDHEIHLAGAPTLITAFSEVAASDNARIIPLIALATLLILALALRNAVLVALSLLIVVCSAVGALGIAGWLGIQMTSITTALPQILVAIGVADSVHVLATFRRRRLQVGEPRRAAFEALRKNFLPTLITTVTTAAGFLSFATSDIKPIAGLGLAAACGTVAAWFFTYLILGGILFLVPFRVLAKTPAPAGRDRARRAAEWVVRQRRPILATFTVLIVAAAFFATRNRVDADPVKYFADDHTLRRAIELIDREVGSSRSVEVVISSGRPDGAKDPAFLAKVDDLETWIEAMPEVTKVVSVLDTLKDMHRALNQGDPSQYRLATSQDAIAQELLLYSLSLPQGMDVANRITMDSSSVRLTVLWTIGSSSRALAAADRIEAQARRLGLDAFTTGKYQLYQRLEGYVVKSFLSSVGIALLLISGILIVLFRSLRLGLIALLPNFIPIVVGGAALYWMGEALNIGTVLVVSVALGIAVDDTVHMLEDFRVRTRDYGHGTVSAIAGVFRDTVPTLLVTSSVLVAAFSVFVVATFTPYRIFGVLTAIVMAVAFISDIIFLPALLAGRQPATAPQPDPLRRPQGQPATTPIEG